MKIFIFCDMEGISGIYRREQVVAGEAEYQNGRHYMAMDINACVQGCFAGGATEVTVRDGHGGGTNVLWHELDARAQYLLGYHAMAGTAEAILEHTFCSRAWQNLFFDNRKIGEFEFDTRLVGDAGVPVIMTSGDDKLAAEAAAASPQTLTVQVKRATGLFGGVMLSAESAHEQIRSCAEQAVRNCAKTAPLQTAGPCKLRLELVERTPLPICRENKTIIDGRTFEVSGATFTEAANRLLF